MQRFHGHTAAVEVLPGILPESSPRYARAVSNAAKQRRWAELNSHVVQDKRLLVESTSAVHIASSVLTAAQNC
eukprot:3245083-Pyramimonas_sp.AAC.1